MDEQITAAFLRQLDTFNGNARLYELSSEIGYDIDWETEEPAAHTRFVAVSAVNVPFSGIETYIFPADADGNVLNWLELDGSQKGTLSHAIAIRDAGWILQGDPDDTKTDR